MYDKKVLLTSIALIFLLLMIIPTVSPVHLHTDKYAYSYGFPFNFLTLYIENGTKFLIPNLVSGRLTGWSLNLNIVGNFIIIYIALKFIFKRSRLLISYLFPIKYRKKAPFLLRC